MNDLVPHKPKVPMAEAATILSQICEAIDAGVPLTDAVVQCFDDSKLVLADAVDRRICFDQWIKGAIDAAKSARDEWAHRAKQLEHAHEAFKANTQAIVEGTPDIPFKGALGTIALQKSPPALETSFQEKELSPALIEMFGIAPEFYTVKTTYTLNTKAVKDALALGAEIPWASLVQGQHVRFRK